jgi:hypothetical protein
VLRPEQWLVDYSAPYVDASSSVAVPSATRACIASFCIQGARAAGGYSVYFAQPGQTANKTGYVYVFNRFGTSIADNVAYVVPLAGYALVAARDAHMPGVTVVANNNYYNAWVTNSPQWHVGPLPSPPATTVTQAVAAVYVETDGDVVATTWVPTSGGFDYKTGGYGRGVVPIIGYMGDMIVATAKVDLAVYGRYAFLVRRDNVHVYSFATELGGSRLDVPIKAPYPGYYTVDVFYNGTRIRSGVYWLDQGGAVYLGVLGPPLSLVPIQPVQPQTATPIYTSPMQPLEWLPRSLPLPAAVSSNPIEVSAAAALAVALAAAYVTYSSSRRLELGLAAAIVAFFATVSLLLPADYRWMVSGWVAFLVTAAMLLIVYYMTR